MTREAFIKKWLGNRDYNYCEEHKNLMRDDLDSVLDFHQEPVKTCDLADVGELCDHDYKPLGCGFDKVCVKCDKKVSIE